MSDQLVSARHILAAVLELQRDGPKPLLEHLEQVEPELANYLMENLSLVHKELLMLGVPTKRAQRLHRQIESLALVCITALRKAHYELWQTGMDGRLQQLDPTDDPSGSDPAPH